MQTVMRPTPPSPKPLESEMNIIELAKQADAYADAMDIGGKNYVGLRDERFAALVRNAALEEAAMLCDVMEDGHFPDGHLCAGVAWECAAAIRKLKEKT